MKFTSVAIVSSFAILQVSALPLLRVPSLRPAKGVTLSPVARDINPALVPAFGVTAGQSPDGNGNCAGINGANGKPILIPCACPPSEADFLASLNANVAAGHVVNNPSIAVSFPEDDSTASAITRVQSAITALQNLHGPGVGCPAASTTFSAQLAALQSGAQTPASAPAPPAAAPPAAAPPAAAPPAAAAATTGGVDPALVPEFGVTAGAGPDGHGNCQGINGILIPCACPPSRDDFIASLSANVAAGHDVNNPAVLAPFPTDSSTASQITRLQTAISSLQNLHGAGVGCPAASTTFSAQLKALTG